MIAFGISFIDNLDFLEFFTFPNFDGYDSIIRRIFFSEEDATEFESSADV